MIGFVAHFGIRLFAGIGTIKESLEPTSSEAVATQKWAALLLAMLLSAVVLIGSMVMVLYLKRRWRPSAERRVNSAPAIDAWAEAGRRAKTPPRVIDEPPRADNGGNEADD